MRYHAAVEDLSAYLDEELADAESRQIEQHLDACGECAERFQGMRKVVSSLRHLERQTPSSTLDQLVARRIAVEGERVGLFDRLERSLASFERQSSLLALFALVIALALMILIFAGGLEHMRNATIPVIFKDPRETAKDAGRREVAGRVMLRDGSVWVEQGVDEDAVSRVLEIGSPAARTLLARRPELTALADLDGAVVFALDGEVLKLR